MSDVTWPWIVVECRNPDCEYNKQAEKIKADVVGGHFYSWPRLVCECGHEPWTVSLP